MEAFTSTLRGLPIYKAGEVLVAALSYNIKERAPDRGVASTLLSALLEPAPAMDGSGEAYADIVVVAFQEVDMRIAANFRRSEKIDAWIGLLDQEMQSVGRKHGARVGGTEDAPRQYSRVATHYMMGLLTVIYALSTVMSQVHDVESVSLPLGYLRKSFGNKGCVAVSFCVGDTTFLTINCHLLHGETRAYERAEQLGAIFEGLVGSFLSKQELAEFNAEPNLDKFSRMYVRFTRSRRVPSCYSLVDAVRCFMTHTPQVERLTAEAARRLRISICDFYDHVLLLGDLNFRSQVQDDVEAPVLSDYTDELSQLMQNEDFVLRRNRFVEDRVRFPPTYKYIGDGLDPERNPSWCDRCLFLSNITCSEDEFVFHKYDSLGGLNYSDHKPVRILLSCLYKTLDKELINRKMAEYCALYDDFIHRNAVSYSLLSFDAGSADAAGSAAGAQAAPIRLHAEGPCEAQFLLSARYASDNPPEASYLRRMIASMSFTFSFQGPLRPCAKHVLTKFQSDGTRVTVVLRFLIPRYQREQFDAFYERDGNGVYRSKTLMKVVAKSDRKHFYQDRIYDVWFAVAWPEAPGEGA